MAQGLNINKVHHQKGDYTMTLVLVGIAAYIVVLYFFVRLGGFLKQCDDTMEKVNRERW